MTSLHKSLLSLTWACLLGGLLTACSGSDATDEPSVTPDGDRPTEVTLRVEVDNAAGRGSRASNPSTEVNDVLVMLFTEKDPGSNTPDRLWRVVNAENISEDLGDGRRTFDIKLDVTPAATPSRLSLVAIANGAGHLADVLPGEGLLWSYSDVQQKLHTTLAQRQTDALSGAMFTMWGVAQKAVETDLRVQTVRLALVRDLCRVEINLAEDVWSDGGHRLAYGFVYNRHDDIFLMPRSQALSDDYHTVNGVSVATPPTIVPSESFTPMPLLADYLPWGFYVPEQNVVMGGDANPSDSHRFDRPALVVGIYYKGDASRLLWYRVDFLGTDGKLIDLVRNTGYVVNVTSINGPGEETPEGAYKSVTTHVTAEIVPWTMMEYNGALDGSNWIAAQNAVTIGDAAGATASIVVKSNVDVAQWRAAWADATDDFASLQLQAFGADGISDSFFNVTAEKADDESTILTFTTLTALPSAATSAVRVLHVSVTSSLRFVIVVTQSHVAADGMHNPWGETNIYGEL